jgi:hypothetical protein
MIATIELKQVYHYIFVGVRRASPEKYVAFGLNPVCPVGVEPLTGDVIGFLIGRRQPGDIYVTGDTVWYEGTAEVAKRYRPKLVIAFAGAAEPRGAFDATMDANDVIETAHAFPAATIVGVHNHGWGAHFTESAQDLAAAFSTLRIAERLGELEAGKPARFAV